MKTPIGTLKAVLDFAEVGGTFTGRATGSGETVELHDVTALDAARYSWTQRVSKPMRLHLSFDVMVAGDTLAGSSRAGRLPAAAVAGVRRAGS